MTRLQDAAQLYSDGQLPEAVVALQAILADTDPQEAGQAALLLGALLQGNGDVGAAADAYRRGAELGDAEFSPACDFALGVLSEGAADAEQARAAYTRALESGHREHGPKAGFNLGLLEQRAGRLRAAETAYRAVLAFGHPEETPKAARNLGGLLQQLGERQGAAYAYRMVIEAGPNEHVPAAGVGLGALLEARGDDEGAAAAYRFAADSDDAQAAPVAAMKLAAAAVGRGDIDEAETRYRQAVDSGDPQIRRQSLTALTSLDELREAATRRGGVREQVLALPQRWISVLPEYFPMGYGGGPMVMMPWDDVDSVVSRRGFYDWQPHGGDPMRNAPRTDPQGGVVYFDARENPERLTVLFDMLGVEAFARDYTAIWADSDDFARDGFLTCLRVINRGGLARLDHEAAASLPDQGLRAGELLQRFVAEETRRYSRGGGGSLSGTLGGDGDWAYEDLCFGMMVENAYWQVYRIWSRPWLVTK